MRHRGLSVRGRTTLAAAAVVSLALLATAALVLAMTRRAIESTVVNGARSRAAELVLLVKTTPLPAVLPDSGEKGAVVQVVRADGSTLAASAQIVAGARLSDVEPPVGRRNVGPRTQLPITGDQLGDPFRVVAYGGRTRDGRFTVYVATSLDSVDETVAAVGKILLVVLPLIAALGAATAWHSVGRALRPVDAIRRQVADIGERDLARRVPEPATGDEIDRLARGMNEMLDRLEAAAQRQKRFIADASHELQSPLASSLASLEVARTGSTGDERWRETVDGVTGDLTRLSQLVRDLLMLASADSLAGPDRPVDLDDVVRREIGRVRLRSAVPIDSSAVGPVEVRGSEQQLSRVAQNLLDNAVRHASSAVSVALVVEGTDAVLVVHDDGPGIAPENRAAVFERFVRLDDSRSRATGGTGLGLAIVRDLVAAAGGTVAIADSAGGARFVVRIPCAGRSA